MATSPIEQFAIHPLVPLEIGGIDVSFTNSSLWMCVVAATAALLMTVAASSRALVPSRLQSIAELSYGFVANMIHSTTGTKGMQFFPFILTLFLFVLFANLFGLMPFQLVTGGEFHQFTVTSHIIVTFALALFVFAMVIVVGLWRQGLGFLGIFAPAVPWYMLILLIPIEIISFLSRPISLSVRLFANMMAGHLMLAIFGGFVVSLIAAGGIFMGLAVLPLAGVIAVTALEFLIAFLQAYVFAILTCIYLNDALNVAHH